MIIRDAQSRDVKALVSLEESLFDAQNYALSAQAFYYHIRHNMLLVAQTDENVIVGYLLVLIRRQKAKVYSIGISTSFRARGIAHSLLDTMDTRLGQKGFEYVVLEVRCDNENAIRLYLNKGFKILKTLQGFYKDGCDAYLMEKEYAKTPLSKTF